MATGGQLPIRFQQLGEGFQDEHADGFACSAVAVLTV